jgi:hypothetical protein
MCVCCLGARQRDRRIDRPDSRVAGRELPFSGKRCQLSPLWQIHRGGGYVVAMESYYLETRDFAARCRQLGGGVWMDVDFARANWRRQWQRRQTGDNAQGTIEANYAASAISIEDVPFRGRRREREAGGTRNLESQRERDVDPTVERGSDQPKGPQGTLGTKGCWVGGSQC